MLNLSSFLRRLGVASHDTPRATAPLASVEEPATEPHPAAWIAGKTQQLWCEPGRHEWSRAAVRGRKPTACPDHR